MKVRFEIVFEYKDRPRQKTPHRTSWAVAEEAKAQRAVERLKSYPETTNAFYNRVVYGDDAIIN
jgi:ribulose bisphosphate carboxylase small subunit